MIHEGLHVLKRRLAQRLLHKGQEPLGGVPGRFQIARAAATRASQPPVE
jgi:hypothetical protein